MFKTSCDHDAVRGCYRFAPEFGLRSCEMVRPLHCGSSARTRYAHLGRPLVLGWRQPCIVILHTSVSDRTQFNSYGASIIQALNYATGPLWRRQDDYIRSIIAAFFVAIFAVGGVYLTPDLKTPAEWVSWLQLVIAAASSFAQPCR